MNQIAGTMFAVLLHFSNEREVEALDLTDMQVSADIVPGRQTGSQRPFLTLSFCGLWH